MHLYIDRWGKRLPILIHLTWSFLTRKCHSAIREKKQQGVLNKWTWVWANSGKWWRTGNLACCSSWGHRVRYDLATEQSVPFSSVKSLSRVRLFATPWIAAPQASLSIIISRSSFKLTSIESVMPSSHLILCRPLLLLPPIPPSVRVFSSDSTLCMRWPKYWSFSFSIIPSKEIPGLIAFTMD